MRIRTNCPHSLTRDSEWVGQAAKAELTIGVHAELALFGGQPTEKSPPVVGIALVHEPADKGALLLLGGSPPGAGRGAEGFVHGGVDWTSNNFLGLGHRKWRNYLQSVAPNQANNNKTSQQQTKTSIIIIAYLLLKFICPFLSVNKVAS